MTKLEAMIKLTATETVNNAIEKFSDVVDDKIKLHRALSEKERTEEIGKAIKSHIECCPATVTLRLTKTKIAVFVGLFFVASGGSAEVARKLLELLAKWL